MERKIVAEKFGDQLERVGIPEMQKVPRVVEDESILVD
jgi:hypothetical protein